MQNLNQLVSPELTERTNRIRALTAELQTCLPPEYIAHCTVVGWQGENLKLVVDSPVWSARIRFYSNNIIDHFKQFTNADLKRVKVKVTTGVVELPPRTAPRKCPVLPAGAVAALKKLAADTQHPRLSKALRTLCHRASLSTRKSNE